MNRIKKMKNLLIALVLTAVSLAQPLTVQAEEAPYTSLTLDKDGYLVSTVDGYLPDTLWDTFGENQLKSPSDLFIFNDEEIYIADTGNKRILVIDKSGNFLNEITGDMLKGPTGVFVTEDKNVYVADPKAKAIFVFSESGELLKQFDTPVSPLFGANAKYAPTKVVVNNAKTIYAISEGNTNGVLNISDYGDFYGYFGANNTYTSLSDRIKRTIFTDEQLSSMQKNVPASAINLDIDDNGLIYTVTQGTDDFGLKKYNIAGKNMFDEVYTDQLVIDVAVGSIENVFTISKQGYIIEYTRDGRMLFYFGGKDDGNNRMGLFTDAVAIDVDSANNIYVLDNSRGDVTVLKPTQYADMVHESLSMYQEGFYLESKEPWEKVLEQNSLFDFAYRGIGEALYKLEDYSGTLEAARLGGDEGNYSNAFWQIRNTWIRENVVTVFWIIVVVVVIWKLLKKFGDKIIGIREIRALWRKFKNLKYVKEFNFLKYVLKNPADAFYGIKFEGKVSVLMASIVYLLVFVIYVVNKYFCGFLFKSVPDGRYDLVTDIALVLGVSLLFVICNNLVCSIRDGEATFKQNYCCFAYCFMPYIFLKPVVFLLSHVLTYNESFIITMLNFIIIAGTAVLITVMVREIQAYTYRETFISLLLTIFTMIIVVVAGVIIFALFKQVIDFVVAIYKEGYYRGR